MSENLDEFNMYRALLTFAVCDHVFSIEEQNILSHHLKKATLTENERFILTQDLQKPQSVEYFYNKIESAAVKKKFCEIARTMVWCDGDITRQEKEILKRVSCFKDLAHSKILKESGESPFIHQFMKSYEDIAYMNENKPFHLFEKTA